LRIDARDIDVCERLRTEMNASNRRCGGPARSRISGRMGAQSLFGLMTASGVFRERWRPKFISVNVPNGARRAWLHGREAVGPDVIEFYVKRFAAAVAVAFRGRVAGVGDGRQCMIRICIHAMAPRCRKGKQEKRRSKPPHSKASPSGGAR